MQIDFEELMANKSEEGLIEYINNAKIYTPEAIYAAINELKKRGRQFTSEELEEINSKLQAKCEEEKKEEKISSTGWKQNIVTDAEAPQFYSQRAIWGFSAFFTVIFGAVLLASNLTDKKAKWIVIGFGSVYTAIAIFILNQIPRNTGLTLGINGIGALILTQLFWNKYIGKDTKYRIKPILKPLIISILIMIPFILAIIFVGVE